MPLTASLTADRDGTSAGMRRKTIFRNIKTTVLRAHTEKGGMKRDTNENRASETRVLMCRNLETVE